MEAGVGIKIALKRRSRLTRALKKLMRAHSFFLSSLSICASVLTSSTFVLYLFVPIVINYIYIPICHSLFVCTSFTVVFSLFVPIVIKYIISLVLCLSVHLLALLVCASVLTSSTFVFCLFVPIVIKYLSIPISCSLCRFVYLLLLLVCLNLHSDLKMSHSSPLSLYFLLFNSVGSKIFNLNFANDWIGTKDL